MDMEDLEDMLFNALDSQNSFEDSLSDFSDEDLLFSTIEDNRYFPTQKDAQFHLQAKENDKDCPDGALLCDRYQVISKIEYILENIVDSLLEESDSLTITLKTRSSYSRRRKTATEGTAHSFELKERHISFPGANAQEAWNFTVLLRILELIHGALVENTIMTKRDIYYRHPDLFVKQAVVDRYVDDIACTLGITRSQLNVTAAAKGLVAGNFKLVRESGNQIHGMNEREGMLVPVIGEKDRLELDAIRWILVIEKEATFRSLLSSKLWEALSSHGMALTAKGYPDLASRKFLCQLMHQAPHIATYALMDLDPDGIAILSTYKYGSSRLAHERAAMDGNPGLGISDMQWLGVKSHQIGCVPVDGSKSSLNTIHGFQGLMKLTARDRNKAIRMLEWDLCGENGQEPEWREELQRMLMLNVKAEMQILDELPGGMVSWIRNELDQMNETTRRQLISGSGSDDGMLF